MKNILRLGQDMAMALFLSMGVILVLVLSLISEAADKAAENPLDGNMQIVLFWPDGENIDVDLWVKGPDGVPVGYSNKNGPLFNLERDDLGELFDISGKNWEVTRSRGIMDGDYLINAHLFNLKTGSLPVPLTLMVQLKKDSTSTFATVYTSQQLPVLKRPALLFEGLELTLAGFRIEGGKYINSSFHTIQTPIRAGNAP